MNPINLFLGITTGFDLDLLATIKESKPNELSDILR